MNGIDLYRDLLVDGMLLVLVVVIVMLVLICVSGPPWDR